MFVFMCSVYHGDFRGFATGRRGAKKNEQTCDRRIRTLPRADSRARRRRVENVIVEERVFTESREHAGTQVRIE
jgi:hypothetical protein